MIFRNKAPEPGVDRIGSVVTHHKIMIHLKGVRAGILIIYENGIISGFKTVVLIISYHSFVKK